MGHKFESIDNGGAKRQVYWFKIVEDGFPFPFRGNGIV